MVIALSGRRIDAVDAEERRFPLSNIDLVRKRIRTMLEVHTATALVSSAACGADLIALREAGLLGLPRRIVLPSSRERFKRTSVLDRPGDWDALYEDVLNTVSADGNLVVLDETSEKAGFSTANLAILNEATALAEKLGIASGAALVWNGSSRGEGDLTEEFGKEARRRGLPVVEISTL